MKSFRRTGFVHLDRSQKIFLGLMFAGLYSLPVACTLGVRPDSLVQTQDAHLVPGSDPTMISSNNPDQWGFEDQQGRSTAAAAAPSILEAIPAERREKIVQSLAKTQFLFISGKITRETYAKKIQSFRKSSDIHGNRQTEDAFELLLKLVNYRQLAEVRQVLVMHELTGTPLSAGEKKIMHRLGINMADSRDAIVDQASRLRPAYSTLVEKGAQYDAMTGEWDLTALNDFQADRVKNSPQLVTSLGLLISPLLPVQMANVKRNTAIVLGKTVFLPPVKSGPKQGLVKTMTRDHWMAAVERGRKQFSEEITTFVAASKHASSYSNLMSGQFEAFLNGGERGYRGSSATEIERDTSYDVMNKVRINLADKLGVPLSLKSSMLQVMTEANKLDKANLEAGIQRVEAARNATIALVAVPVALYVAPILIGAAGGASAVLAGGAATSIAGMTDFSVVGFTLTGTVLAGQSIVATMALMPAAFSLASTTISASTDHFVSGQRFWESFLNQLPDSMSQAALTGSAFAIIPVASMAIVPAALAIGGSAAIGGALKAKAVLDLGAAAYFTSSMVGAGWTGGRECLALVNKAKGLEAASELEAQQDASSTAIKECADAGINIGFALTTGANMSISGFRALNAGRSETKEIKAAMKVLGLKPGFTDANLKNAYRDLAKEFHPDVNQDPNAHLVMSEINWAKGKLTGLTTAEAPAVVTGTSPSNADGNMVRTGGNSENSLAITRPIGSNAENSNPAAVNAHSGNTSSEPFSSAARSEWHPYKIREMPFIGRLPAGEKAKLFKIVDDPVQGPALSKIVTEKGIQAQERGVTPVAYDRVVEEAVKTCIK